jgi:SagB-type dehydrogenase family enzyme
MSNWDTKSAWRYHDATKHSPLSVRNSGHSLDWTNKPIPFKIYPTLEPLRLDQPVGRTELPALQAVSTSVNPETAMSPNLNQLGHLLYFSAGVTKKVAYPGGTQYFRAAPCTGALYEIELYVVCGDLEGLAAGVYHFGSGDFTLRRLREGDFRGVLRSATGNDAAVVHAPAVIVCTGTYWRNAWKYQARTYRHFGWDNGTMLANMLALAAALGLPTQVTCGFVDSEVNQLLDLDTEREVAFSLVPLGHVSTEPELPTVPLSPLNFETVPLSETEVDYPEMGRIHKASSLETPEEVVAWRASISPDGKPSSGSEIVPMSPLSEEEISRDSIEGTILRRGSTRKFAQVALTREQLSTMLDRATRGIPADFWSGDGSFLNDLYLIVNAVDGIEAGSYFYHCEERKLELLRRGDFRGVAAHLGLDQSLPGDASLAVFFLADLRQILERFGNRGYRCVQLESGILGGRLYLTAYAQRLGATGLTFYDDKVIEFFSPHAAGKSAIFLTALGKSVRRV